jgi:hypothetical protein
MYRRRAEPPVHHVVPDWSRIGTESGGGRYCPGVRGCCLDASTSVPIGV